MKKRTNAGLLARLRRLPKIMPVFERRLIFAACITLLIGIGGITQTLSATKEIVPAKGGELVEGIVATNASEVESEIDNLVGLGLMDYNYKGELIGGLAKDYSISPDNKTYTFNLKEGLNGNDILEQLKATGGVISAATSEATDTTVTIKLSTPFSPLLADLSRPIPGFGPYNLVNQNKDEILLEANQDYIMGDPYIPTIRIKIYPQQSELTAAAKRGEVTAAYDNNAIKRAREYTLSMQRHMVLFFNLNRDPWKNTEIRKKLANNEILADSVTMNVTTTQSLVDQGVLDRLKKRLEPLNVAIESQIVDTATLQKDILPERNFDILLYGIDIGRDPDPYPFWHSSQIKKDGQNLSGFSSKPADRLLEEARLITSKEERQKKYAEFQKIFDEHIPAIFLEQKKINYFVSKKVKGVKLDYGITPSDRFANVWEWYIKTQKK